MRIGFNPVVQNIAQRAFTGLKTGMRNHPGTDIGFMGAKPIKGPLKQDVFEWELSREYKEYMNRDEKLTADDYTGDVIGDKYQILKHIERDILHAADDNLNMAYRLKDTLDRQYGEDGYVFVSLGKIPAVIGKVFEATGVETKYLPLPNPKHTPDFTQYDYGNYKEFLKNQNLTTETMKNSEKKYIVYDYSKKGPADNVRDLMVDIFGLPEDTMVFRDLNKDLRHLKVRPSNVEHYINTYLQSNRGKLYTTIASLPARGARDFDFSPRNYEKLTRHNDQIVKEYSFAMLYKLNTIGCLGDNPENKNTL